MARRDALRSRITAEIKRYERLHATLARRLNIDPLCELTQGRVLHIENRLLNLHSMLLFMDELSLDQTGDTYSYCLRQTNARHPYY